MKISIIGASGFVGKSLVNEAIIRELSVKAIARNAENIPTNEKWVEKIAVNVLDTQKLTNAIKGSDVVISAYNAGWTNPNIYADFIAGSKAIEKAVTNAGVKRYIVIGGAGSLFVADNLQAVDTPDFPEQIKPGATAARDYLNSLTTNKDLDWVFFSPAFEMSPDVKTGRTTQYRLGKDQPVFDTENRSRLSVEDLAVVIFDEIEHPQHHQERFTAAY